MNDSQETLNRIEAKVDATQKQVGEIHVTVFGAQGQGGLLRDHAEIKNRVEKHETKLVKIFTAVAIGLLAIEIWLRK